MLLGVMRVRPGALVVVMLLCASAPLLCAARLNLTVDCPGNLLVNGGFEVTQPALDGQLFLWGQHMLDGRTSLHARQGRAAAAAASIPTTIRGGPQFLAQHTKRAIPEPVLMLHGLLLRQVFALKVRPRVTSVLTQGYTWSDPSIKSVKSRPGQTNQVACNTSG